MSGGKSSTSEEQSSVQSSVSGVNTGKVAQGSSQQDEVQTKLVAGGGSRINIGRIDQIPEGVSIAFKDIVETVNKSLDLTRQTVTAGQQIVSDTTKSAINSVAQRSESSDQPDLSTITKLVPVLMVAVVAVGLVAVFKK